MQFLITDGMEPDQISLQLGHQVIVVLFLLEMIDFFQFLIDLSSLVQVDETSSDIVWVAVGDEGEIFEENSDVWDGRYRCYTQFIPIVLII